MLVRRLVAFLDSASARTAVLLASIIVVICFSTSHLRLGMNPFLRAPRIYAVLEESVAVPAGSQGEETRLEEGTLVEVSAAGSFGAVIRAVDRGGVAPALSAVRLSADDLDALGFVTLVRVSSDVTARERPDPLAQQGAKLSKDSAAFARTARYGWIELWCKNRWGCFLHGRREESVCPEARRLWFPT